MSVQLAQIHKYANGLFNLHMQSFSTMSIMSGILFGY